MKRKKGCVRERERGKEGGRSSRFARNCIIEPSQYKDESNLLFAESGDIMPLPHTYMIFQLPV